MSEDARFAYLLDKPLGDLADSATGASHVLGVASGYEEAANWVKGHAGDLFSKNQDGLARYLRDTVATELIAKHYANRTHYDRYEEPRRQAVFAELDRRDAELNRFREALVSIAQGVGGRTADPTDIARNALEVADE